MRKLVEKIKKLLVEGNSCGSKSVSGMLLESLYETSTLKPGSVIRLPSLEPSIIQKCVDEAREKTKQNMFSTLYNMYIMDGTGLKEQEWKIIGSQDMASIFSTNGTVPSKATLSSGEYCSWHKWYYYGTCEHCVRQQKETLAYKSNLYWSPLQGTSTFTTTEYFNKFKAYKYKTEEKENKQLDICSKHLWS